MADDRSITGSAAAEADVHDDDELAEVLAAELERYATGTVPVVPRPPLTREAPMQPLAVPRSEPVGAQEPAPQPAALDEGAFARRAAEVERAMRRVVPSPAQEAPADAFRRSDRPSGRRSATGPIVQPAALPTADDLPVKRRTGFRPPPSAVDVPPVEPLDRVLPTGPVSLPEATATLLDSMISDATGPLQVVPDHPHSRHAAPTVEPEPQAGPIPGLPRHTGAVDGLYDDWEQSLRAIGRPRAPWEQDDEIVPTGGDPDLPTVAITVPGAAALPRAPFGLGAPAAPPEIPEVAAGRRRAHALPEDVFAPAPVELVPVEPDRRARRSGRRRADAPADAVTGEAAVQPLPTQPVVRLPDAEPGDLGFVESGAFEILPDRTAEPGAFDPYRRPWNDDAADDSDDADDEGIDEVEVDYPVVSAATTGAIDLPQSPSRPRTAPVFIERVRTAILQLPAVPSSPTGSGAAAIVGRWLGAFASPLMLVLAFGLAAAGSGPAASVAVLAGALLAAPAVVRSALWSAGAHDDSAMHETAVLGRKVGHPVAVALLLARLVAASTVLLMAGATAGAWADRTGAFGLGSSSAALLGCAAVAVLAVIGAAMPARVTAVLALLAATVGAIGTLLLALVLAPNGGSPVAATASGGVAAAVGGFVAVGLLLVLCGSDVARWRTDIAHPVSTAVGAAIAALSGAVLLAAGTVVASRLTGGGGAVDDFAGALSDASASALAAPLLVILLVSAVTLPALLLRSSGAAAARLLGAGRPVRLGSVAAGLLALAGALAVLAAGTDPAGVALAAAAVVGAPVAAWAGLLAVTASVRRPGVAAGGLVVATLLGWLLADGLVPGASSPVLSALGPASSSGLRGGPAVGIAVALVVGVVTGLASRAAAGGGARPAVGAADTVEG